MCTKLRELEEALASFAGAFDAALISASEAEGVMERAARIEHMGATLKALAAARLAETELWGMGGDKSPAHNGCSAQQASAIDQNRFRCRMRFAIAHTLSLTGGQDRAGDNSIESQPGLVNCVGEFRPRLRRSA